MLNHTSKQGGVSLIETLVGLAIVSMLLIAGAPGFAKFMQNRKVRNAAEAIENGLALAKTEAVSRNTGVTFTLTADTGWTVGCTNASANCPASIHVRSASEGSSGMVVPATTIAFNGFGKMPVASADATIDITNPNGTCEYQGGTMRCLRVVVSTGGRIRSCDPQLTNTNPTSPQAC